MNAFGTLFFAIGVLIGFAVIQSNGLVKTNDELAAELKPLSCMHIDNMISHANEIREFVPKSTRKLLATLEESCQGRGKIAVQTNTTCPKFATSLDEVSNHPKQSDDSKLLSVGICYALEQLGCTLKCSGAAIAGI
jgi:hypothetical protein